MYAFVRAWMPGDHFLSCYSLNLYTLYVVFHNKKGCQLNGQIHEIFQDEDPDSALESLIDENLKGCYPMEDIYKVGYINKL